MKLVVTCRELRYAGSTYLRGAEFEASERDAKLLKAIKKADDAPQGGPVGLVAATMPAPAPQEPPVVADALSPDVEPALIVRPYRTRRMKAED